MVSTNLPVMVTPGVSADVLVRLRVKRTVNKARINVKIFSIIHFIFPFSHKNPIPTKQYGKTG